MGGSLFVKSRAVIILQVVSISGVTAPSINNGGLPQVAVPIGLVLNYARCIRRVLIVNASLISIGCVASGRHSSVEG